MTWTAVRPAWGSTPLHLNPAKHPRLAPAPFCCCCCCFSWRGAPRAWLHTLARALPRKGTFTRPSTLQPRSQVLAGQAAGWVVEAAVGAQPLSQGRWGVCRASRCTPPSPAAAGGCYCSMLLELLFEAPAHCRPSFLPACSPRHLHLPQQRVGHLHPCHRAVPRWAVPLRLRSDPTAVSDACCCMGGRWEQAAHG